MSLAGWASHFSELCSLLECSERHHGTASAQFSDSMVERFELAIHSCISIVHGLENPSVSLESMSSLKSSLHELIQYLRSLLDKWKEYRDLLDSNSFNSS